MADDTTIIEGSVKFRDGKKWKSRWCVMRKLSPVADCIQLQVYRDSRARWGGGGCKASLSLAQFVGCEAGFALDRHCNTLAVVCRDLVAALAFDTRERLLQWQVKIVSHLGETRQYLVQVSSAPARRAAPPAGPARLHLAADRVALVAGTPPRLLGVWELQHLRRFGVVEGRFCFEGGTLCGKGEGLYVMVTDQAKEIARDFDLAIKGKLSPRRRPFAYTKHDGLDTPISNRAFRPDTRMSEINTIDRSLPANDCLYEDPAFDDGGVSPYWPSVERLYPEAGSGDTASVCGVRAGPGAGAAGDVSLARCVSCMSALGAMSRSSTSAATPRGTFRPAWTMDAVEETERAHDTSSDRNCPPERPPRAPCAVPLPHPTTLELRLTRRPRTDSTLTRPKTPSSVGPYENYDVPKLPVEEIGEYYDTPKRLKECLNDQLFKVTKSSTCDSLILKKSCGCLLQFGKRRKEPMVIETEEINQQTNCACRRVTDWANNWIRLPYCHRNGERQDDSITPNKENVKPRPSDLYAKVDLSRKSRRKTPDGCPDITNSNSNLERIDPHRVEIDDGPLANYENLDFALSLEHYENAKDLLRKVGLTQVEMDAIAANLNPDKMADKETRCVCNKCGHERREAGAGVGRDEYLLMEPAGAGAGAGGAGYAAMLPALRDKCASNPALCVANDICTSTAASRSEFRKRSSSADSSRFLDDVKEFDGSTSSVETLRNLVLDNKLSDAESSEASKRADESCEGDRLPHVVSRGGNNRDSSSSNDSGVSTCSRRRNPPPPRRARSTDPPPPPPPHHNNNKSCSAEAEVPLHNIKGPVDSRSTSSGTSDMSDYIETLSLCSSHSSTDTPITMRMARQTTSTLRPRSGKEYQLLSPRAPPHPPHPPTNRDAALQL